MPKNLLKAFFADDDDDSEGGKKPGAEGAEAAPAAPAGPRSLADAWERITEQNKRLETRLEALETGQRQLLEATRALQDTAKQQLDVLKYLGRFAEAGERRGREMEAQFRGVPDVLRTLPSATKEQAERLSEIAARLYEKAQDNTVNALRSAQATHERTIEDLIDKSLGATRRATYAAIVTAAAAVVAAVAMWLRGGTH
jgi:hypothetical protein